MKLTRQFECYPRNFTEEIEAIGEKVNVLYGDNIVINFPEIIEIKTPIMDDGEVTDYTTTYKKVTFDLIETEEGQKKVIKEIPFDGVLLTIKADDVINRHNPNPKKLLTREQMDDLLTYLASY